MKMLASASTLGCCLPVAQAEKVMFHDERLGTEIWRMSSFMSWHEYGHAGKPSSYEGRWITFGWRHRAGSALVDLKDGSEVHFGRQHRGRPYVALQKRPRGKPPVRSKKSGVEIGLPDSAPIADTPLERYRNSSDPAHTELN